MECRHAKWFKGHRIPASNGMPERAWGAYLPGDEPGWECGQTGEPCIPESLDCPLWHKTGLWCPDCFSRGHISKLFFNEASEGLHCPVCWWDGEEESRIEAWKELKEEREEKCTCQ